MFYATKLFFMLLALLAWTANVVEGFTRPGSNGLKIEMISDGIAKIDMSQAVSAGLDETSFASGNLALFRADTQIPFYLSIHDTDAYLTFYAPGYEDVYTGTDVFWLYSDSSPEDGAMEIRPAPPDPELPELETYIHTETMEKNLLLWPQAPGAPELDFWFWQRFYQDSVTTTSIYISEPAEGSSVTIKVYLVGWTDGQHGASISINNGQEHTEYWQGAKRHTILIESPGLPPGYASVKISSLDQEGQSFYLDKIEAEYTRKLVTSGSAISFKVLENNPVNIRITGFSDAGIIVMDVTDPLRPVLLGDLAVEPDGTVYAATFMHPGGEKTYCAAARTGLTEPERMEMIPDPSWLATPQSGADYLLITVGDLVSSCERLLELRKRQGHSVMSVPVETIYNAFSGGRFSPDAIREFLKFASSYWNTAPRYVLLAGDANIDFFDNFSTGKKNIVPPCLAPSAELGLIPSDNPYACLDDDDRIPDLYIGRIPGNDPEGIRQICNKIVFYESDQQAEAQNVLFVTDDDSTSYETQSENLALYLPSTFTAHRVYARLFEDFSLIPDEIARTININNILLVNYIGHGDVFHWGVEPFGGGEFIWEASDITRILPGATPPLVLSLNCLNGYFAQSARYSLAEEWVLNDPGAIACFAPSGLGYEWDYNSLNSSIFTLLFDSGENIAGRLATDAKITTYNKTLYESLLDSFNLIGDPATRLAVYRNPDDVVTVYRLTAETSSGGHIEPIGATPVFQGEDLTFEIVPDTGYKISEITVDGVPAVVTETYTFYNVNADHTIYVTFIKNESSGGGGGGGCFINTFLPRSMRSR